MTNSDDLFFVSSVLSLFVYVFVCLFVKTELASFVFSSMHIFMVMCTV